ncbi:MAG: phytoene/squalene synthase family protein, partial [Anaerolineae bacterium]
SNEAVPYAIKLGVALQMTNILRDVGEDYRNGRVYLPREEMDTFGITEQDLACGLVTERWRELMRFQIARTRALYAEAWPGIRLLEREGRLAIAAAGSLYRGILDVIERNDYDVFSRRASLGTWAKLHRVMMLLPTI